MLSVGATAYPAAASRADAAAEPAEWAPRSAAARVATVAFEENLGQTDASVRFVARLSGATLFFTPAEIVMVLPPEDEAAPASVVRMSLVGGAASPQIVATGKLPGLTNHLRGDDPSAWTTGVASYSRIVYEDVYPGIDLAYYGSADGRLEYDFLVGPGADPSVVRWSIVGAEPSLSGDGALALDTGAGVVAFEAPILYQDVAGERVPIDGRYVLDAAGQVGFVVGAFDAARTLVIDPVLALDWSTYLGRTGVDLGAAIAVDGSGNAYVTGHVLTNDFPASMVNGYQTTNRGADDAFVAKFDSAGVLVYFTYLGGVSYDYGNDIGVDAAGNAYVVGWSISTGAASTQFPTTVDAYQQLHAGATPNGGDAFLAKLGPTGAQLLYSTFLGGSHQDQGEGVAVGASGTVVVTGWTFSTDFPATTGAHATGKAGGDDAFVARFNASGTSLAIAWASYLGGASTDHGHAVAVDPVDHIYVVGQTFSTNFPLTTGAYGSSAYQTPYAGAGDAFITEFDPNGASLRYSTPVGGTGADDARGVATDAGGFVYVAGTTASTGSAATDLSTTTGAYQATHAGATDAYVLKFGGPWTRTYATFLGGTSGDGAADVVTDGAGAAFVIGTTGSTDFPLLNPYQSTPAGQGDAYFAKLSSAGALVDSTLLGGTTIEGAGGIDVHGGDAYLTGYTESYDFPTRTPHQANNGGGIFQSGKGGDAFVTKLCYADAIPGAPAACVTPPPPACPDVDGNGAIDAAEQRQCDCDTDHDGTLSLAERRACDPCQQLPTYAFDLRTGSVNGVEDALGQSDSRWVLESSPVGPGPAVSIPTHGSWIADPAGTNWIGVRNAAGVVQTPGVYVYAAQFSIPSGYTSASITILYAADEEVSFALNGNPAFASTPAPAYLPPSFNSATHAVTSEFVIGGINTLRATVTNAANWTGLLVDGGVSSSCEPATDPCDTDGDGVIGPNAASDCYDPCDLDRDGIVTPTEQRLCDHDCYDVATGQWITNAQDDECDDCDHDEDGLPDAGAPAECFAPCDTDRNGTISWIEQRSCEETRPCYGLPARYVQDLRTGSTNGVDDAFGATDGKWYVLSAPSPLGMGPAESILAAPMWVADPAGSNWINALDDAADPMNAQAGGSPLAPVGTYVYALDFLVPASYTHLELRMNYSADDAVSWTLNGHPVFASASAPAFLALHPGVNIDASTGHFVIGGTNQLRATLLATVANAASPPRTGLLVDGAVTGECTVDPCDADADGFVSDAERAACCAEDPKDPCDTDGDGKLSPAERLACCVHPCDTNDDGQIDAAERRACQRDPCDVDLDGTLDGAELDRCKPCDADQDGVLTTAEKAACAQRLCRNAAGVVDPSCFHECDTDLDGLVSEAELDACGCDPCDTDGDGNVTEEEALACEKPCRHPCDRDGDGEVDREERSLCGRGFDECDTDRDGAVSPAEKRICAGIFDPCDTDMSGFVDADEQPCREERTHPCDRNGDGEVSPDEAAECRNERDECDTDRDGVVDEAEKAICKGIFHACDVNMDGALDPRERERCECFDPCDANKDGVVDDKERRACGLVTSPNGTDPNVTPTGVTANTTVTPTGSAVPSVGVLAVLGVLALAGLVRRRK